MSEKYHTARTHTGRRHIIPNGEEKALCGHGPGWESAMRPLAETKRELICKVCLKRLAAKQAEVKEEDVEKQPIDGEA